MMLIRAATATILLFASLTPFIGKSRDIPISVEGKVLSIKCLEKDQHYISLEAKIELEFRNESDRPIIILKPSKENQIFWLGSIQLSLAKFLAFRSTPSSIIWDQSLYPSVYIGGSFAELAKKLDSATPPSDLTVIIAPQESWKWSTTAGLYFYSHTMSSSLSEHDLPYDIISQIKVPLWMRLTFLTWPDNLTLANKQLANKLQKRWASYGLLYVDSQIKTEPIEIKLYDIPLEMIKES
jgi:hypothetical protein